MGASHASEIRKRIRSEETGFSLIELLVVVVIIGTLAAIAIPAFLGQSEKAQDSEAKSAVRNAESAAEAYFTDDQTYVGMDEDALRAVDPSLNDAGGFTVSGVSATGYTLKVDSESTGTFTIAKAGSTVTRTCGPAARENSGGCKNSSW
jgi:type IV pilus assembly protein PilA